MQLSDIHLRDPFVVPMREEGRYYLYGTTRLVPGPRGFDTYTSSDLKEWHGPFEVFRPEAGFWADRDFWAAEVHRYQGRYFMFASFKAEGVRRGTAILVADSPRGPFHLHSDGPVTPREWECLDGTLYIDDEGTPWIVFCHEWVQVHDGEMCALRLTPELDRTAGDPILLFRASELLWIVSVRPGQQELVTDGPCLHRARNGELLMLWSTFGRGGYGVATARSTSGRISGPWKQDPTPLYSQDGGHGSLFRTFDGQLMLQLHKPNKSPHERPLFLPVREDNGRLHVILSEAKNPPFA